MPSCILWLVFAFAAVVLGIHLVQVSCKFQMQSPQATPCPYFNKVKIFSEENSDFLTIFFLYRKYCKEILWFISILARAARDNAFLVMGVSLSLTRFPAHVQLPWYWDVSLFSWSCRTGVSVIHLGDGSPAAEPD